MNRTIKFRVAAHAGFKVWSNLCAIGSFKRRKGCEYPGFGPEIIDYLLEWLNIPYEIIPLNATVPFGDFDNATGNWSGALGDINNGEYDTIASPATSHSIKRLEYFDMTAPVLFQETMFITARSTYENLYKTMLSVLVRVFEPVVLVLIAAAVAILAVIASAGAGIGLGCCQFWKRVCSLNNTDSSNQQNRSLISKKIVTVILCYTILLFTGLYRGVLLSSLLIPVPDPPIDEVELLEQVRSNTLQFLSRSSTWKKYGIWRLVREGSDEKYRLFQAALDANPPLLTAKDANDSVIGDMLQNSNGRLVFYASVDAKVLLNNQCKYNLHSIRLHQPDVLRYGFLFKKNSTFAKMFNEAISRNYGLLQQITDRYLKHKNCSIQEMKALQEMDGKPGIAELKLSNLISCFAVGGLGLLMALIVMLLEKCWTIVNMPTMKKQLEPGQSAKISVSTADHGIITQSSLSFCVADGSSKIVDWVK